MSDIELDDLFGVDNQTIIAENAIATTKNTKGLATLGAMPGEIAEDGSYIDGYGIKHYPYGAKYQMSPADKRLTENGAYSGKQIRMQFSDEELRANPLLGLEPRDYQTVMLYMKGLSRRDIASELEVCEQTVTTRLAKPSVKACMMKIREDHGDDIQALVSDGVEALRDAVAPAMPIGTRLAAARDILKATGHMDKKVEQATEETATTQMQKILAMFKVDGDVNITVENS